MTVFLCSEHIRDYRAACLSPGIEYSKQYKLHNPSLSGSKWHSKEGSPGPLQQVTDGFHTVWAGRDKLHTLFHILVTSERSSVISPCFTRAIYTKELFAELFFKKARWGPFLRKDHLPASKTEQFVLIGYGWLLLKLPHQDIDQVWVFNHNRHFLKHVLKGDACLFQSVKHVKTLEADGQHGVLNWVFPTFHPITALSTLFQGLGPEVIAKPESSDLSNFKNDLNLSPKIRSLAKEPARPV